jgi:2-keto-4-pentenoate hydratase/2-oxohepta-3-ene-1,7-dioic acid hydratase in catechol pathway
VKLATVETPQGPVAVVERDGAFWRLESSIRDLLGAGPTALAEAAGRATVPVTFTDADLLPVIPDPGKILCVGRNYLEHVEELGNAVTTAPEIFVRTSTSLARPYGPVIHPKVSDRFDWEVELAVIIGTQGRHIPPEDAYRHIAGYAVFNDFTARDYQRRTTQWTPGKNFDQTGPLGPYLVTPDEVGDPAGLDISLTVDGERMQHSNTRMLIHTIPAIIHFLSTFATLQPGDVIATGTPGGVGDGRDPKVFLRSGQVVVSTVQGLGQLRNVVQDEVGA